MNIPLLGKHVLSCMLLFAVATAHAESPLSLDEAIRLADQSQPLLQSLDDAASASREAAVAEGQLPDPRLRLGVLNLPVTNGDAGRFNRDDMTMSTIGVMQEMIPQAKRDAASRRMEATAEQFQSEQAATAQSIRRDVALAWLDVYEAQRKSALYERMAQEMAAERKVAGARVSSGAAQASDALKLESQLAMTNDKRLLARRDEQKARAMLARWIGGAAQRPLAADLPLKTDVASTAEPQVELDQHPLLQNARQIENVALSEVERAKAERQQNWSWEVMYGKRRSDLSDMVSFQVALDLPWDRANRQDRRTAEKLVMVERARKLTEDRRRELASELAAARAEWEIAQARETEHQTRLIPAAEARLSVLQAGYAAGKQSLAEVWEARRSVIEVEMEHWSILTDQQRAAVKLSYLLNTSPVSHRSQP